MGIAGPWHVSTVATMLNHGGFLGVKLIEDDGYSWKESWTSMATTCYGWSETWKSWRTGSTQPRLDYKVIVPCEIFKKPCFLRDFSFDKKIP